MKIQRLLVSAVFLLLTSPTTLSAQESAPPRRYEFGAGTWPIAMQRRGDSLFVIQSGKEKGVVRFDLTAWQLTARRPIDLSLCPNELCVDDQNCTLTLSNF